MPVREPLSVWIEYLGTPPDTLKLDPVALKKHFPFLSPSIRYERSFLVAYAGEEVVGILMLMANPMWFPGTLCLSAMGSHIDYRNRGVATGLTEALFDHARKLRINISVTAYEPDGRKWLRPVIWKTQERYPDVQVFETPW